MGVLAGRIETARFLVLGLALSGLAGAAIVWGGIWGDGWEGAAAVGAVVGLWLAIKDERVALGLLVLSFLTVSHPAFRLKVWGLWIPLPAILAALFLLREVARRVVASDLRLPRMPLPGLLLLAAGLLASGFSVTQTDLYLAGLVKWGAHLAVFLAVAWLLRELRWASAFADGLAVAVGLLALYGLYRIWTGAAYDLDVFEGVGYRTSAAFHIAVVLPIVYARLTDAPWTGRLWRIALFGVLLGGLVYSFARAAWIASAFSILAVGNRRLRSYLPIALALVVLVVVVPQEARDRFQTIFVVVDYSGDDSRLASSTVMRTYLLLTGLAMAQDNWLHGVGVGSYSGAYHRYAVPGAPRGAYTPHNFYVLLLAEAGVAALAGWFWFFGGLGRRVWQAESVIRRDARATVRGLKGSLVAMAIEGLMFDGVNILITWTLLGVALALVQFPEDRRA